MELLNFINSFLVFTNALSAFYSQHSLSTHLRSLMKKLPLRTQRFLITSFVLGAVGGVALGFGFKAWKSYEDKKIDYEDIHEMIRLKLEKDKALSKKILLSCIEISLSYDRRQNTGGFDQFLWKRERANTYKTITNEFNDIFQKYKAASKNDILTFAGSIAFSELGGSFLRWRPGRCDGQILCEEGDRREGERREKEGDTIDEFQFFDEKKKDEIARIMHQKMKFSPRQIICLVACIRSLLNVDAVSNCYLRKIVEETEIEKKNKGEFALKPLIQKEIISNVANKIVANVDDEQIAEWIYRYAGDASLFNMDTANLFASILELNVSFDVTALPKIFY